ncbi:MAG TPA: flagellar assembly protein A, partial [Desulfosporosinus sp.]|nr:flagellar assembly protein A [Desulfosporosinus sp.]
MPIEIVRGHSLEEIRQEWALKLKLSPEDITLEVVDKPGVFSRQWKVRLIWADQILQAPILTSSQAIWDGTKYSIALGEGVKQFRPFIQAGEVWLNGELQDKPFRISSGDRVEYHPYAQGGLLTWEMQVRFYGLSAVVKVRHEQPGHYTLPKDLPAMEEIDLAQVTIWESLPATGEIWDETRLNADLDQLKVVHGRRLGIWPEIMAVQGVGEVVIAVATPAVPSENAKLEDFVGMTEELSETGEKNVDFFASRVQIINEGAVLARKIPGKLGVPGKDVFGKVFPAAAVKDFQFRLKKNVYLSDDGLEVVAACAGQPVRLDEKTYMVE